MKDRIGLYPDGKDFRDRPAVDQRNGKADDRYKNCIRYKNPDKLM